MVSKKSEGLSSARIPVSVCLIPERISHHNCAESIVVVIDILRATTTICTALGRGAACVVPVERADDCLPYQQDGYLIAGERGGQQLPGFDLGNSPVALLNLDIRGKQIALTTTNGTRALYASLPCQQLVVGSFANISLLVAWLRIQTLPVVLHCAGWRGEVNWEDTFFAGTVVARLQDTHHPANDSALLALTVADARSELRERGLNLSSHVERLEKLGAAADLAYCFLEDTQPVLPLFDGERLQDIHRQPVSRVSQAM